MSTPEFQFYRIDRRAHKAACKRPRLEPERPFEYAFGVAPLVTLHHADARGDTALPTTSTGQPVSFPGAAANVVSVSAPVRFLSTNGNTHTAPFVAISTLNVS